MCICSNAWKYYLNGWVLGLFSLFCMISSFSMFWVATESIFSSWSKSIRSVTHPTRALIFTPGFFKSHLFHTWLINTSLCSVKHASSRKGCVVSWKGFNCCNFVVNLSLFSCCYLNAMWLFSPVSEDTLL